MWVLLLAARTYYGAAMVPGVTAAQGSGALSVLMRFQDHPDSDLGPALRDALIAFSRFPGFNDGEVTRAIDDPSLFMLAMSWVGVGAYRRALSDFDIKVHVVPLLSRALDEPSAYEVVSAHDATSITDFISSRAADAHVVSLGEAAAGEVPPQR